MIDRYRSFCLIWISVITVMLISACTPTTPEAFTRPEPRFVPEEFFSGTLRAWGIFIDRLGNTRDQFTMSLEGRREGDLLTLDEHFLYHDGTTGRRLWTIRKVDATHYEGTAADVDGVATGTVHGNSLHWRFVAPLQAGADPARAGVAEIDQWMLLQDSGDLALSHAQVRRWGIEIGEVTLFFRRM